MASQITRTVKFVSLKRIIRIASIGLFKTLIIYKRSVGLPAAAAMGMTHEIVTIASISFSFLFWAGIIIK